MDKKQYQRLKNGVLDVIESLAHCQGFYGRLLRDIRQAEENGIDTTSWFMRFKDCKSRLDIVLKIECED